VESATDAQALLAPAAKAFRVIHTAIGAVDLAALGYIWACAISRRRGPLLTASVAALTVEAAALVAGRGSCPLGPLQTKLGDPVPLFELVLPPRAAKAAVPVLTAVSVVGVALVAIRAPSENDAARPSGSISRRRLGVTPQRGKRRLTWH
jgi:hypothetical protein